MYIKLVRWARIAKWPVEFTAQAYCQTKSFGLVCMDLAAIISQRKEIASRNKYTKASIVFYFFYDS